MDRGWWKAYIDEVRRSFQGTLVTSFAHCYGAKRIGIEDFPNSGIGAIFEAVGNGASRIILLGYDCQHTEGRAHWHADHPKGLGNAKTVQDWPAMFDRAAKSLKDIEIVNCTRQTALTCFVRADLEQVLNDDQNDCDVAMARQ